MAVVATRCDGTITINDGTTPTALTVTVAIEPGDFTFTPPRKTYVDIIDRCAHVGRRANGWEKGTLQFSFYATDITSGSTITVPDIIDGRGAAAARVSTDTGEYEDNVLEVVFTVERSDYGGTDNTVTFPKVALTWSYAEGDPNVITVTGEVLTAPTFSGPA